MPFELPFDIPFEILFYVLIAVTFIGFIVLVLKTKIDLKTFYKIKIVVLHPGCNIHRNIKPQELPHEEKIEVGGEEKIYTVKNEDLWKIKHSFIKRPLYFLQGIKGSYLCLFRSNESGEPIKNIDTMATPVLIRNVKRSRILKLALKEVFGRGIGGFGKFILIFGGACLVLYMAWQQGLIG